MPVFREQMRSSGSTDFERTATLKDMDEMAFGQEASIPSEYGSSPMPGPGSRLLRALNCDDGVTTLTSRDEPRDRANNTQTSRLTDRMSVFRDDPADYGDGAQAEEIRSFTFPARQPRGESNTFERAELLDNFDIEENTGNQGITVTLREEDVTVTMSSAYHQQLLQQLQTIAAKRTALLDQLASLQIGELEIIAQLAQATEPPSLHCHPPRAPPATTLNAPILPTRQRSFSRAPRPQPPKMTRNARHTRNFSAPTISRPATESGRRNAVESVKRVPLSEKEEASKREEIVSHSRSRSEFVLPISDTKHDMDSAVELLRKNVMHDKSVQPWPLTTLSTNEETGGSAIVSDIPHEMRFPVRSRALSQSSVKSQASVKSQSNIKKGGRSKSRESAKNEGSVKNTHGRSMSRTSDKSEERKKSQSRSKSRNRGRPRAAAAADAAAATTAVQPPPPVEEQAKRAKLAPRAHLGKKWEF